MTSQKLDFLPIKQLPCGSCIHLQKNKFSEGYHCIQNRHLDEYMPAHFAEKCANYSWKGKIYEGLEKVKP